MLYCSQCGRAIPEGQRFCGQCGARIMPPRPPNRPAPAPTPIRPPQAAPWRGLSGKQTGLFVLAVLVIGLIASQAGNGSAPQTAAPATGTATAQPSDTVAPVTTRAVVVPQTETALAPPATPTWVVEPTPAPPPTSTRIPPRVVTAAAKATIRAARVGTAQAKQTAATETRELIIADRTATAQAKQVAKAATQDTAGGIALQLAAERADFRTYAALLFGVQQECVDAATVAQASLNAVSKGRGTAQSAYDDADAAQTTCDGAKSQLAHLTVPDSLSTFKMDQATNILYLWADDESKLWNDVKTYLQNPNDLAAGNDAKKLGTEVSAANIQAGYLLYTASTALKAPLEKITPVVPTPVS